MLLLGTPLGLGFWPLDLAVETPPDSACLLYVEAEARTISLSAEVRTFDVPAEERTFYPRSCKR